MIIRLGFDRFSKSVIIDKRYYTFFIIIFFLSYINIYAEIN